MQYQLAKAGVTAGLLAASCALAAAGDLLPAIRDIDTPSGWQLNGTSSRAERSSSCVLTTIRLPFDTVSGVYFHVGGLRNASAVSVSFSADEISGNDILDATYETLTHHRCRWPCFRLRTTCAGRIPERPRQQFPFWPQSRS
jgi:hypothetical protein